MASTTTTKEDGEAVDLVASQPEEVAPTKHAEPEPDAARIYFVRMPRPPMDDALLKRLQTEFQGHITEIKGINARLAAKRDVVRNHRSQMSEARSLKGSSQPEFEEKLNRLKQLRELRSGYLGKIAAIKGNVKGLDFKTEAELDAKIQDCEDKIRFGSVPLREEKHLVQDISKLRNQRDKIKEFESQKSTLKELEAEGAKIKAVIEELDGEFSIIKGERDSASKVMGDFYTQLKAAEKSAEKVEEEQKEAVEAKNAALEALEAARREIDSSMTEYRDNRKFSLQVRDLVALGQAEEAQALCDAQADAMLSKLNLDTALRSEYCQLWADQRRNVVSDLLPESSTSAAAAAAAAPKGAKRGKDKDGKDVAPVKLVARGAEKAKDLIASIMAKASSEAAHRRSMTPAHHHDIEDLEEEDFECPEPEPGLPLSGYIAPVVVPKAAAGSGKLVTNANAKAQEVFGYKVELPVVGNETFVLPASAASAKAEAQSKEDLREEQRVKAKEAEERKAKAAELAAKKKAKAVEMQKKADDDIKKAKLATAAAAVAAARSAEAAKVAEAEAAAAAVESEAASGGEGSAAPVAKKEKFSRNASPTLQKVAKEQVAYAKRAPTQVGFLRRCKKVYSQHEFAFVISAVVILLALVLLMASMY